MGRSFDGLAAGQLAIAETSLSSDTFTPFALYYNGAMTNLYATETMYSTNLPYLITNLDGSITTNQFMPVASQNVWSMTNYCTNGLTITTNIQAFTNCLVPTVVLLNNQSYLVTNSTGTIYTNYECVIRQVRSYQTFVDVVTPDTNETTLNFYFPNQIGTNRDFTGLFTNIIGTPFVTWTIQNPQPSTANHLNIIETRNSNSSTQSLVKATSAGGVTWTLTLGTGSEQRVETRQIWFNGSPTPTDRIETNIIQYANSSQPAYACGETYHSYPWGWELTQTVIPNGSAPLITTYRYYDYADNPEPYAFYGNGQIKQINYPDGYWEKRVYEDISGDPVYDGPAGFGNANGYAPGLLRYVFYPRLDGTACGITSPDQTPSFSTVYKKFWYILGSSGAQEIVTIDGWPSPQVIHDDQSGIGSANGPEGQGPASVSLSFIGEPICSYGTISDDYAESTPLGLAGHPWCAENYMGKPSTYYYYDNGVYDASAGTFSPTESALYVAGVLTNFPDHKQSSIAYVPNSGGLFTEIDGHPLTYLWMGPMESTKQCKIYHNGNLVQHESYVYEYANTPAPTQWDPNFDPQWALIGKSRYYYDSLGRTTNVVTIDTQSSQIRTLYSADYRGTGSVDGPLLLSETDANGQQTRYSYDSLQRVCQLTINGYGGQSNQVINYTYDANGQALAKTTTAGSITQTLTWSYDLSGRVINTSTNGLIVSVSYSADNQTTTQTFPGAITVVNSNYPDRRLKSQTGNGVVNVFYDYSSGVPFFEGTSMALRLQKKYEGYSGSPRWHIYGTDGYDQAAAEIWPVGMGTTNVAWFYRNYYFNGWLDTETHSEGSPQINYTYDDCGVLNLTENFVGTADLQQDRSTATDTFYTMVNGIWYLATTNYVYLTDGATDRTVANIHLEQMNGFGANQISGSIDYDTDGNETITTVNLDRSNNKITATTSEPGTSTLAVMATYQNRCLISASTLSVANPTTYSYDALGRTNLIQDAQGNFSLMSYDPNTGWLTSTTDPAGHKTTYAYYSVTENNSGKLKCQTDANGKKTYYSYTTQGKLYQTWGDVPYPTEYRYNEFGDLTNLITFRGGSGWASSSWPNPNYSTGDNTYWAYDAASGSLASKTDAQTRSTTYSYDTTTGKLLTRSWARTITVTDPNTGNPSTQNVTMTNIYNGFGDIVEQDYNDGTPSVQFNNYNRSGQPREVVDGAGTNEFVYDLANRILSSTYTTGPLAGVTVSNHFNPNVGRDALRVIDSSGAGWTLENYYGYDAYGRLGSVTNGTYTATYGYVPNSDLLQSTTLANASTAVLTTTRNWNFGFQLAKVANCVNGVPVTSHSYTYDAVNRRSQAKLEDNSTWTYSYNDRNELVTANRNWYDSTAVSGQQFGYAYDNIGNRIWAQFGGDTNGNNLQTIGYQANNLNQYSSIQTPGFKDIVGVALVTNNVVVNASAADRKGEYFHRQINVLNTGEPVWQTVTVASGQATNRGGLIFPASNQTLLYDADGNLSFDGVWTYQWDGENRLSSMWMTNGAANLASSNCLKLDFAYDRMGRRIQKVISAWNGSAFKCLATNMFVYDGWSLVATLDSNSALLQSFLWGNDLSGTMTMAGGIGGLLSANFLGTNCFVAYDGNGNVTALINSSDNSTAARYEYGPFGNLIRASGCLARENPFRYSTKVFDEESGLIYSNHRYYNPDTGRWISRDATGEKGGVNLMMFVKNTPLNAVDPDGNSSRLLVKLFSVVAAALINLASYGENGLPEDCNPVQMEAEQVEREEQAIEDSAAIKSAKARGVEGGRVGGTYVVSVVILAVVEVDTVVLAAAAYAEVELGITSANPLFANLGGYFKSFKGGDSAWGDLDALMAAIEIGGGTDEGVIASWGALQEVGDSLQ